MKSPVTVSIAGGGGQVAYSLIFPIAAGQVFGDDQPVNLILKEVPEFVSTLEGVKMELEDCAFPLLGTVKITDTDSEAYRGANWILLVGASPRKPYATAGFPREMGPAEAARAAATLGASRLIPTGYGEDGGFPLRWHARRCCSRPACPGSSRSATCVRAM